MTVCDGNDSTIKSTKGMFHEYTFRTTRAWFPEALRTANAAVCHSH